MKFLLSLAILVIPAFAHEGPVDGFGCHGSKGGTYHCHSGPLSGRSFVSKKAAVSAFMALEKEAEAADQAAIKAEAQNPKAAEENEEESEQASVTNPPAKRDVAAKAPVPPKQTLKLSDLEPLKVVSWSASMMGKDNVDYKQIAHLISYADLVIFEDVSLTDLSREALNQTAAALSQALNEKICRAVVLPGKEAKSRSVMLWKDRKFAFVRSNGMFKESCNGEYTIPDRRGFATLYVKHAKQFVVVAPVSKDSDVGAVFSSLAQNQWPAIVAGDFAMEYAHASLKPLRDQRFIPTLPDARPGTKSTQRGFQKSLDNLWFRGLGTKDARLVDLAGEYPDVNSDLIRTRFSDRLPVYSEFRFAFEDEALSKRQPTAEPVETPAEPAQDPSASDTDNSEE